MLLEISFVHPTGSCEEAPSTLSKGKAGHEVLGNLLKSMSLGYQDEYYAREKLSLDMNNTMQV